MIENRCQSVLVINWHILTVTYVMGVSREKCELINYVIDGSEYGSEYESR